MEASNAQVNIKQEAIKNGLIMAGISIVIFLAMNYIVPEMQGSFILLGIQLLIGLAISVVLCLDMRKKVGGYWTFSDVYGVCCYRLSVYPGVWGIYRYNLSGEDEGNDQFQNGGHAEKSAHGG